MTTRRKFMTAAALVAAVAPLASSLPSANAKENKVELMFVQTADDLKADGQSLRLVNVSQQTVYFSDRPVRVAGHLPLPAYLGEWEPSAGPDNFGANPPNATLSVYEPGHDENTLAVVEISHPVMDGKDLVYSYKLVEGTMPKAGGATALFIDWIGVGGGVGRGFHGVGVGFRGPGFR